MIPLEEALSLRRSCCRTLNTSLTILCHRSSKTLFPSSHIGKSTLLPPDFVDFVENALIPDRLIGKRKIGNGDGAGA